MIHVLVYRQSIIIFNIILHTLLISQIYFAGLMYRLPTDTKANDNNLLGDINMTLHDDPALVDGVSSKALSFNGVDQYAEINSHRCVRHIGFVSLNGFRICC